MLVVKVDQCLGCKSCEVACAVEHSVSKDLYEAIRETPGPRSRVVVGQGAGFAAPLQCRQCQSAPCVAICPTDALKRADANSPVILDHEACIGCMWCVMVCPFGVITMDPEGRTIIKCDQCFERVQRGELPACVDACPTSALEYKSLEDVVAEKREASLLHIERAAGVTSE
jgi:carbon-monoxide dehydrogenase iron sulfur subunit